MSPNVSRSIVFAVALILINPLVVGVVLFTVRNVVDVQPAKLAEEALKNGGSYLAALLAFGVSTMISDAGERRRIRRAIGAESQSIKPLLTAIAAVDVRAITAPEPATMKLANDLLTDLRNAMMAAGPAVDRVRAEVAGSRCADSGLEQLLKAAARWSVAADRARTNCSSEILIEVADCSRELLQLSGA